jgi:hypothetical protein
LFCNSDDEGSDEEEDDGNEEEVEEDDDEDYHEAEGEEEEQEDESPSFFFGTNSTEQQNGFQFGVPSSNPETVSGLSSMIAKFDFNTSSSFNFGVQSTTEVFYIYFLKNNFTCFVL